MADTRFFEKEVARREKFSRYYDSQTQTLSFVDKAGTYDSDVQQILILLGEPSSGLPPVSTLQLDQLFVDDDCAQLVARIIRLNLSQLKTVSLRHCTVLSSELLCEALETNQHITTFDIHETSDFFTAKNRESLEASLTRNRAMLSPMQKIISFFAKKPACLQSDESPVAQGYQRLSFSD